MITDEQLTAEANRIITEFERYTNGIKLVDTFYHGTFGRCLRFELKILEGETFRILFHQTGLTILNNSTSYESFEQFFNSNSEAYRQRLEFL